MAGKGSLVNTGAPTAAKPVQTVRFEEGTSSDHSEAKARGDRSRFFKDGSEFARHC